MTRAIRTYSMADRAVSPDFAIRDEKSVTRIAEAHRHEYFQIQLNLAGRTTQHIAAAERPLGPAERRMLRSRRLRHCQSLLGGQHSDL